jgi:hypothetical protein
MANNIFGPGPNAVVSKSTVDFVTAGINSTNTEIIYLVGNPLKSYIPGRAINGITGFEAQKGYYLVAKVNFDIESIVAPPLSGTTQLATPGNFTPSVISSSQINLAWDAVASATGYTLQRATNSGFTTGLTTLVNNLNQFTFNDTGLNPSTQYFYRVKALASGFTDSNYATTNATTSSASFDTDAQAYFDAIVAQSGTISSPNKTKVNDFIVGLKAQGLWTKMKCVYLYHGNVLNAARLNAKNPLTTTGAFCITWVGTPTLDANGGMTPSSGNYGNTNFHPDGGGLTSTTGASMGFVNTATISANEYTMGLFAEFYFSPAQDNAYARIGGAFKTGTRNGTAGFHMATREPATNNIKSYFNGTLGINATEPFVTDYAGASTGSFCAVGAMKEHPSTVYPSVAPLKLSFYGEGMTSVEAGALNTLIQAYIS